MQRVSGRPSSLGRILRSVGSPPGSGFSFACDAPSAPGSPAKRQRRFSAAAEESDGVLIVTRRADRHQPRIIVRAAGGLPPLDAAAVWILGAVRHLLRRGRPATRDAWEWVDSFDDLKQQMLLIRDDAEPPANRCPLVPVRMPVEVDVWPNRGEALPLEHEDRQLGAVDNRRLVGKVAKVLIDHIVLHQQAAIRYRTQAQRDDSDQTGEKADGYAMEVRERGRRALRGVDLEELARAVQVEARAARDLVSAGSDPSPTSPGLTIHLVNDKLAIVSEGGTTVHVRGVRQVWLFRCLVKAEGRTVTWSELMSADLAACGEELDRRRRDGVRRRRSRDEDDESDGDLADPTTPRHALREESLRRTGSRIRKVLGKLSYHWHQDGHGARWDRQVT